MPAFSVVIPLFNKRPYITRCLESVCRQTLRDFEVIVVDDGSSDGSGAVAEVFPDRRIRVLRQENQGVSAARNRGIQASKGELVAFLDADDEWLPLFLEGVLDLRREYPGAGILATGFRRCMGTKIDTETTLVAPPHGYRVLVENFLQVAMHGNFVTSSSAAVPRAVLADMGGFPEGETFGEDRDLWTRIALKHPVAFDVRILAIYHSEALGRACNSHPALPPYPPAVKTLRRVLEEGRIPPDKVSEIQGYIDLLRMQYSNWQISLRDRANAERLLREEYLTPRFRTQAIVLRYLLKLLPMRAVEAIRLKPQSAMMSLRRLKASVSGHGVVRRTGGLVIREVSSQRTDQGTSVSDTLQTDLPREAVMISGWYGTDNAGDDAILEQFVTEIIDQRSRRLFVLTEVPARIEQRYAGTNVVAVLHASGLGFIKQMLQDGRPKPIHSLRNCDLFVLGVGGILRDNTSWSNLIRLLDEIWLAKLFGVKVALYAIGAGPFKSALGKWLIRRTLTLCDLITVREASSKEQLAAIGVPPARIVVGADPAILLTPKPVVDTELRFQLTSLANQSGMVGLFVEEDYTPIDSLAAALDELYSKHNFRFVSVPMRCHGGRDDRQAARMIRAKMKHPEAIYPIEALITPSELKWVAGQFRFNITVRLHALIFSLSMCTPAVAINYEPKVEAFLKSFDLETLRIDVDDDVVAQVIKKALECDSELPNYVQRIRQKLVERSESARLVFTLLNELLDGKNRSRRAPSRKAVTDADVRLSLK